MSFFRNVTSASPADSSSTLVHRSGAEITGVREAIDELTGLTVTAFPMTMVQKIIPARAMMTACYMLAGTGRFYIGESTRFGRRLYEHSTDQSKAFAQEAFVITRGPFEPLEKTAALYLQCHLTRAVEEAGIVTVQRGTGPQMINPSLRQRGPYLQMALIVERLLFDAGCTAFHGHANVQPLLGAIEAVPDPALDDDAAPIEIGVGATPGDAAEYQLAYSGLWARGYAADAGFVVTAGSEVRREINASVNPILHTRRNELSAAGALAEIPGVEDRLRLKVAVWFPSPAIAAKVLSGAHVASDKWTLIENPRPFVLEA